MNYRRMSYRLLIFFLFFPFHAWPWGGRGHHTICEAAVFLVKEKALKESLRQKPYMMGHLCNVPDFYWKSLGPDVGKLGNASHFVDVEVLGAPVQGIPADYRKIISEFTGKKNAFKKDAVIRSIPLEFGSNWWRTDQFFRRALALGPDWGKAPAPKNKKEEQDDSLPYNKSAYDFYVNLGLMGHFVGDGGQPFHLTADYDGYGAGHGGIHAFYEEAIVSNLPYDLTTKVVEAGRTLQSQANSKNSAVQKKVRFLNQKTVIDKMRALGEISLSEIPTIYKLDPIKKASSQKNEKGMSLRSEAERASPASLAPKFEALIVTEMARSATLLAQLWDEAYVQTGRPNLAAYKSYKYPFTPEFVPPDYFEAKEVQSSDPK